MRSKLSVQRLKAAVEDVGPDGCVIHIAHSKGAMITALAAQRLEPHEMRQIEVIVFGGAAAIQRTTSTPFRRCVNYYSVNDPVLPVVPQAAEKLRSGGLVFDDEFCFLAPRSADPILDHKLDGPTYGNALQWEGTRYKHRYRSLVYRTFRPLFLVFMSIVRLLSGK